MKIPALSAKFRFWPKATNLRAAAIYSRSRVSLEGLWSFFGHHEFILVVVLFERESVVGRLDFDAQTSKSFRTEPSRIAVITARCNSMKSVARDSRISPQG